MAKGGRGGGLLRLLEWTAVILLGILLGSALGALAEALVPSGRFLAALLRTWPLGLTPPATLDLVAFTVTLGFTLKVGLLTVVGLAAAVALYVKLR